MAKIFRFLPSVARSYYEGVNTNTDDDDKIAADKAAADKTAADKAAADKAAASKTFTQDDVNKFLAEERRKAQKGNERTVKELETLRKTANLTTEEKEKLEIRIEDLKNEFLSKEELAKKETKKEADKTKRQLEDLVTERDRWKNLFTSSTIERELVSAAAADAYNPDQILKILKPDTRLTEELDAETGQPTGKLIPKVKFVGKDKDGKPVQLDLSATEAIKQMKEMQEYGNLFRSGANGGLGGNNAITLNLTKGEIPTDPRAYREWRKKNPLG